MVCGGRADDGVFSGGVMCMAGWCGVVVMCVVCLVSAVCGSVLCVKMCGVWCVCVVSLECGVRDGAMGVVVYGVVMTRSV